MPQSLFSDSDPLNKMGEQIKHNQKSEVKGRKKTYVFFRSVRIVKLIFAEGDETCKGCNKSTCTSDIYAYKKIGIIFGKLRKQNSRGNVTDKLAGESAYEKRVLVKKPGKEVADDVDSRHISREDEEKYEG